MLERRKDLLLHSALTAASMGMFYIVARHRARIMAHLRRVFNYGNPLQRKEITVVETPAECQRVVELLKRHCHRFKVVGFDCEWVTVGGNRRPVALLQLSSYEGHCALFRLCSMKHIPKDLRELLEDDDVIKVGVASQEDAQKLAHDFGVGVASTFDLRYLASITGHKPEGLGKLAKTHLNVQLDKSWRLACSDWEAQNLTMQQLEYAANDVFVAVEVFKKLIKDLEPGFFWKLRRKPYTSVTQKLLPYLDVVFHSKYVSDLKDSNTNNKNALSLPTKKSLGRKQPSRGLGTQTKQFYSDNCWLEAPDGDVLCTVGSRKAEWYVSQNLGEVVKEQPYTVRLNFEPAGRAVGDVGRYYLTPKENRCVVCGRSDAYIRKNIVPREYRKHFPEVMKSHSSHDVLLLCPSCHQASNISDLKIRSKLANLCNAPFKFSDGAVKYFERPELKRVKSAARTIINDNVEHKIPAEKIAEMGAIVSNHFGIKPEELTVEMLFNAANLEYKEKNENYTQHGEKVVEKYCSELGGLVELEKLWREHFLNTMQPKYMPELWSINHSADRLEVRANEGRVKPEDLMLAGLEFP